MGCAPGSRHSKGKGPAAAHTWFPPGHKGDSCVCSLIACDLPETRDSHPHAVSTPRNPCHLQPPGPLPHFTSTAKPPAHRTVRRVSTLLLGHVCRPSHHCSPLPAGTACSLPFSQPLVLQDSASMSLNQAGAGSPPPAPPSAGRSMARQPSLGCSGIQAMAKLITAGLYPAILFQLIIPGTVHTLGAASSLTPFGSRSTYTADAHLPKQGALDQRLQRRG